MLSGLRQIQQAVRQLRLFSAACVRGLASSVSEEEDRYLHISHLPTLHFQPGLLRLPIPKLADSCTRYLAALQPVAPSEEAFNTTKAVVEDFMSKSYLTDLQMKLITQNRKNSHTSYISKPWFNMYLSDRKPLVLNYNPFMAFKEDPDISDQALRAANFVWSAVRFRSTLQDGKLQPEVFHLNPKTNTSTYRRIMGLMPRYISCYASMLWKAFPLDMSQYESLFNTTRVPIHGGPDQLVHHGRDCRHILVLRKDNLYSMMAVQEDGLPVPCQTLYNQLQGILEDQTPPAIHPLGCLTAVDRDNWAQLRIKLEHQNRSLLHTIDSALLVLCLDDVQPTEVASLSHQMLHNNGRNRWFDKSLQLIVAPGGHAAVNFEHSWGDGVAVLRFFNEIYMDKKHLLTSCQATMDGVDRLDVDVPTEVQVGVASALEEVKKVCSSLSVEALQYSKYGKSFLKKLQLSPDAILQLAIQISYYRQFHCCVPSYESCSTAAFKHGRTETIRPASIATKICAQAFKPTDSSFDAKTLLPMITKATQHHFKLVKEAAMGLGFDRHLFALRVLAESEDKEVAFFQDPCYAYMNDIILSTSTLSSDAVLLGGFAPVSPTGYGIAYVVMDEWMGVQVSSYPTRDGKMMLQHLEQVFDDLHTVLTSSV